MSLPEGKVDEGAVSKSVVVMRCLVVLLVLVGEVPGMPKLMIMNILALALQTISWASLPYFQYKEPSRSRAKGESR